MKGALQALMLALITLAASCGYTFAQTVDRSADKSYMGQATIGTDTTAYTATDASAWLQIGRDSTNKGLLLPRVGDTSNITSPQFGLTIFSHADSCYYVYKDHWVKVGSNIADYIKASEKAVANGVATLDSNGVLNKSQVPAIAITNTYVEASMIDMLALDADTGDICIRTDSSETFILQSTPATSYDNWKKLLSPGAPVTSVNGYTGVVVLGVDDIGGAASLIGSNTFSGTNSFSEIPIISSSTVGHNAVYFSDASGGTGSSPTYNVIGFNGTSFYFTPVNKTNAAQFSATDLTARRTYTLPDVSGTLSIKENTTLQSVTDNGNTTTNAINVYVNPYTTTIKPLLYNGNNNSGGALESSGSVNFGMTGAKAVGFSFRWLAHDNGAIDYSADTDELMRLTNAGYLGIGKTNPGEKLEVNGNGLFDGNVGVGTSSLQGWPADGARSIIQIGPGSTLQSYNPTGHWTLNNNVYYDGTNYRVAYSATNPSCSLYADPTNGGIALNTSDTAAVGAIITPTKVFSVDKDGNLYAGGGGFFSGITGFGGTSSSPYATINGLGQASFQTLSTVSNATIGGAVTATSIAINGGTSSEYLMADGSVSTGGGSPLIESVNIPLSNPAGTPGGTDAQVTYDGGNYSLTIPAGTFNANDHILIRIKFMYYINISAGTTSQLKMAINGGVKYVITPPVDNTMEKGIGEVDITNVGGDTLNVVQTHDGAYLSDDMNIGVAATDAITFTLYYNQSTTTLGDELNVRPFTVEVMKN